MLCYIDIEHDKWLASPATWREHLAHCMDVKLKLEEISQQPCLVQRYNAVTRQRLKELDVCAVIISGNVVPFDEYPEGAFLELEEIIREAEWPLIGFCGGHEAHRNGPRRGCGADTTPATGRARPDQPLWTWII